MSELLKELEHAEEPEEGFICDDDQKAEWCLLQIKRANAEKKFWKDYYKDAQDSVVSACDATIGRMEMFLYGYFKTVPHKKTKTEENYPLPSGKIMLKAQDTKYEYDEKAVIQWLKDKKKGFIKTEESLDWDGLKKTLMVMDETVADAEGEIIPCIKAVEREPVFKIQVK